MESSAQEALSIGANVFIFIIALTCGIVLMTTVLNMSEVANENIVTDTNSSLMEFYGDTTERVYTGEQVLAMLTNYVSETSNMKDRIVLGIENNNKICVLDKIKVKNDPIFSYIVLDTYELTNELTISKIEQEISIKMSSAAGLEIGKTYNLIYNGKDADLKDIYYFKMLTE